ncbi:MAG: rane protein of unknown function [Candidatus Saccharibacteria bacterium]|jgi:hypothetical protein|nr:rane protein of unknown function [Candidatus Saccharibacteria bacterium]
MFQYIAAFTIKANEIGIPTSTKTVGDGFNNIVTIMIAVVGMVSVIALMVGGLFYAFSHGDAKLIQRAKDTLLYAVIGLIVSIGAYGIVIFLSNAIGGKGPN